MTKHRYHINIFYSDEDRCYVADVPDLKYCSAFGRTPEEALREIQVAVAGWLETAKAEDKPVPEPRYMPFIYQAMVAAPKPRPSARRSGQRRRTKSPAAA